MCACHVCKCVRVSCGGVYTLFVRVHAPRVRVVHVPSLRVIEKVYVQELCVYTCQMYECEHVHMSVCNAPSVCVRKCACTACEWGVGCVFAVSVCNALSVRKCVHTHGVCAWVRVCVYAPCMCVRVHCATVQGSRLPGEELAWGLARAAGGEFEFAWQTARRPDQPEPRD